MQSQVSLHLQEIGLNLHLVVVLSKGIPSDGERHGQHVYSYIYPAENDRFRSPINCRAGAIFIFFWRTLQNQGMSQSLLKRRWYGTG